MKNSLRLAFTFLIFWLSGCISSSTPIPPSFTPLPLQSTFTPEPTVTATISPTQTSTPIPTPISGCSSYATVQGKINDDIPGYADIISASTSLSGTKITVIFTLREMPNEITVDSNKINTGEVEIAYGVAIDTDDNPKTGIPVFFADSGYGYDIILQALHFKQGSETNMSILDLLSNDIHVWIPKDSKTSNDEFTISSDESGDITVDQVERKLTLSANINGITPDSYLHFFTYLDDGTKVKIDQVCQR
jgi:hypothetical protein